MLWCRVDDFPLTKPEESWRHNLDNFKRFNAVMERHGLDYVLGVIPRHTNDQMLRNLVEMPMVEVALHGVNHDEMFPNEFRDHQTQMEVYQAIQSAVAPLEDICGPVDTYIPPHNVIDRKTCNALKAAGFTWVLGGPGTDVSVFDYANFIGLQTYYSVPPLEYGRSDELSERGSVDHLLHASSVKDVFLTLHWTWEWNIGLKNLDAYLSELAPAIAVGRS